MFAVEVILHNGYCTSIRNTLAEAQADARRYRDYWLTANVDTGIIAIRIKNTDYTRHCSSPA